MFASLLKIYIIQAFICFCFDIDDIMKVFPQGAQESEVAPGRVNICSVYTSEVCVAFGNSAPGQVYATGLKGPKHEIFESGFLHKSDLYG